MANTKPTTRPTAAWMSDHPCYVADNDENNPYRLTLYVADNGAIMLAADGNGTGDDIALESIDGWGDADINEKYRQFDLDQLRSDANALFEAGRENDWNYLDQWCDRAEEARDHNIVVHANMMGGDATEDDVDRFVDALRANGYTWAASAHAAGSAEGDASGITNFEWQRIMDEAFNHDNGGEHGE